MAKLTTKLWRENATKPRPESAGGPNTRLGGQRPKPPNPTLRPCWVHPTKSQNSLQEVDAQPNTKLKWPYFGAKQIMAPKKGGKMGHFGAFF